MAEFEDKLNAILADPEAMGQIVSIAKPLPEKLPRPRPARSRRRARPRKRPPLLPHRRRNRKPPAPSPTGGPCWACWAA